jgi:hemerythrin
VEFYKWKDAFSVGVDEIDQQHQSFLDLLNEGYQQAHSKVSGLMDTELCDRIKSYARMHFRFEENLIRTRKQSCLAHQHNQHQYFEDQLEELARKDSIAAEGTFVFLRDWFLHHILEQDKLAFGS